MLGVIDHSLSENDTLCFHFSLTHYASTSYHYVSQYLEEVLNTGADYFMILADTLCFHFYPSSSGSHLDYLTAEHALPLAPYALWLLSWRAP